jgi:hypothetical protein
MDHFADYRTETLRNFQYTVNKPPSAGNGKAVKPSTASFPAKKKAHKANGCRPGYSKNALNPVASLP